MTSNYTPPPNAQKTRPCRYVIIYGYCRNQDKGCPFNHDNSTKPQEQRHKSLIDTASQPHLNQLTYSPGVFTAADHYQHSRSISLDHVARSSSPVPTSSSPPPPPLLHTNDAYFPLILPTHTTTTPSSALQHHLYFQPNATELHPLFLSEELRQQLTNRSLFTPATSTTSVHNYHSLTPIEPLAAILPVSRVFGFPTVWYRAVHSDSGHVHALLRICGYRLLNESSLTNVVQLWSSQVKPHPNIVQLLHVFTTMAFNNESCTDFELTAVGVNVALILAYEYVPSACTLASTMTPGQPVDERSVFDMVCQLANAIYHVHSAGYTFRGQLHPSKILLTARNRVWISSRGVMEFIVPDPHAEVYQMQQSDWGALGILIYCLVNNLDSVTALPSTAQVQASMHAVANQHLVHLCFYLLNPTLTKSHDEVFRLCAPHLAALTSSLFSRVDFVENELSKELENGRIARLLIKLNLICNRQENAGGRFEATGDLYLIKLFMEYVFHQCNSSGAPVMDFAHILSNLNKLDAGAGETILLTSSDHLNVLLVTYSEIKACIKNAFLELAQLLGDPDC